MLSMPEEMSFESSALCHGLDRRLKAGDPSGQLMRCSGQRWQKVLDYGGNPRESVIQNNLGGTVAAGTKQKGAEMTRVIGAEATTVTGLKSRAQGSFFRMGTGSERFHFDHTSCINLGARGEAGGRA